MDENETNETGAVAETNKPAATPGVDPQVLELIEGLRKDLDESRAALGRVKSKETADSEKKARDKGEYERLIQERDARLADLEKKAADREVKVRRAERDRAVAAAITGAGLDLVAGAPAQLLRLWADEFDAEELPDGTFRVQTKDLKTPAQVARERLSGADYEHFVKASARGKGAGRDGSKPAASGTGETPEAPKSVLDWIIARQAADRAPGGPQHERPTGFRRPATK